MARFRNFQTNFSGGLLSEGMLGRVDLAQYENGALQLENWWPLVTGGMRRRPGSLYLETTTPDATDEGRMESFIFDETQVYAVTFNDSKWTVYDPLTGNLLDTASDGPWTQTQVKELSITQKADVMFISHKTFKTRKLTRTGASTFVLSNYEFETSPYGLGFPKRMPFIKFVSPEITINPNNHTGNSVNFIASADVFDPLHVGTIIRYRGKQCLVTTYISATNVRVSVKEELDQGAILSFNSSIDKPHDFEVGEIIVGRDSGTKAEVTSTAFGSIQVAMIAGRFTLGTSEEVEGLTSGNLAKIVALVLSSPPPHANWDEEAFSVLRGWPGVIAFHAQRLWLGGSSSLPAHIFGSKVAAFFNYDTGSAFPDESIQAAIVGEQVNKIEDIVSGRHLQVFTDNAEFYAPQEAEAPLTPEDFDLIQQTQYGIRANVRAEVFDESSIFVQSKGSAVREFIWSEAQRGYSANAISLISENAVNLVKETVMLYGGYDRPEQIAFFVNGDGTLGWYHSARAEQIRTWGKWSTNGKYISLAVIGDKLYALVERTIDSVKKQFFERFELDLTLDASVAATQAESETYSAIAAHLQNTEVDVVHSASQSDIQPDHFLGSFTLNASGDLTLNFAIDNVTVGLSFTQILETMPYEIKDREGITGGMQKRLVSVDVFMASTLALKLNGKQIATYQHEDDLSIAPKKITGSRKFYLLGYSERPTVVITNEIPVPCEVSALNAEVEY